MQAAASSLPDWHDIAYLKTGTARQRVAYDALQTVGALQKLAAYTPVLVGTVPLDIDIPESDLDIICEINDPSVFAADVTTHFAGQPGFRIKHSRHNELPTVVVSFEYPALTQDITAWFPIELFGQPRPVRQQNAYRHMIVEARLLAIGGEAAKSAIRELKWRHSIKTEPAFAQYFRLSGDPYQRLLELADLDDDALQALVMAK